MYSLRRKLYTNPTQTLHSEHSKPCTATLHSNPTRQPYTATLHGNPARTARWQARLSSLEGCTVSNRGQRPRTAATPLSVSLEGCTLAKMAAGAAAPKAHSALMTT